jgi:hypothetical protein
MVNAIPGLLLASVPLGLRGSGLGLLPALPLGAFLALPVLPLAVFLSSPLLSSLSLLGLPRICAGLGVGLRRRPPLFSVLSLFLAMFTLLARTPDPKKPREYFRGF